MTQAQDPALPLDPSDLGSIEAGTTAVVDFIEQEDGPPTDLDERAQQDLIGLMYLGRINDEVVVAGHRFHLQTPTHDDRIERGELHRKHIGSLNFEPMWELLTVATYCVRIDGVEAPEPLNPARVGAVETRLVWIKDTIASQLVIRKIFEQCINIDARERAVVEYLDEQSKF